MFRYVVVVGLFLLFLPLCLGVDLQIPGEPQPAASADQANRYLSAEVTRQIKAMQEAVIAEVNANNDGNFQAFDERTNQFMHDTQKNVLIGTIGATLVVSGAVAFIYLRIMKRYSYEDYLARIVDKQQKELDSSKSQAMAQMQQAIWTPQQPAQTLAATFGQETASNMSQMNAWQAQPAYAGAWKSPVTAQPEYSHLPPWKNRPVDPMDSAGWYPTGGGSQ